MVRERRRLLRGGIWRCPTGDVEGIPGTGKAAGIKGGTVELREKNNEKWLEENQNIPNSNKSAYGLLFGS